MIPASDDWFGYCEKDLIPEKKLSFSYHTCSLPAHRFMAQVFHWYRRGMQNKVCFRVQKDTMMARELVHLIRTGNTELIDRADFSCKFPKHVNDVINELEESLADGPVWVRYCNSKLSFGKALMDY